MGEARITHSAVPHGKWQGNGAGEPPFCSHGSLRPNSHQWIGNLGGKLDDEKDIFIVSKCFSRDYF